MRCVQIDKATAAVVAAILWGEKGLPPASAGYTWQASDDAQPGWLLQGGRLVAPPVEPGPVAGLITLKSDIARRCTEDEAGKLRALLDNTSAQFWLLYMGVQQLEHDAPEFPLLEAAFVEALGADRASEVLAPSAS